MSDSKELQKAFAQTLKILTESNQNSRAENTSSFSDLLSWRPHTDVLRKARDCRLLLVTLSFIGIQEHNLEDLYQKIAKIAHKKQYEGEWELVAKHLQQPPIPGLQLACLFSYRTLDDYFGNDLPTMIKLLKRIDVYNPYLKKNHPVKKTQRKRGYDDKGSLPSYDKLGPEYFVRPELIPMKDHWHATKISSYPTKMVEKENNKQVALVELDTFFSADLDDDKEGKEEKRKNELFRDVSPRKENSLSSTKTSLFDD